MGTYETGKTEQRLILPPDTNLHRRYTVGRFLSADSCCTVYAGFDYKARQAVRILEYFPETYSTRTYDSPAVSPKSKGYGQLFFLGSEAFLAQYSALTGAIGSPNLLSVFDAFFENGTAYAVTEELDGLSLREYQQVQQRNLTNGELSAILRQLADGLLVLHSLSVLHDAISPDSVWLCIDGTVKLAEFGAAKKVLSSRRALGDEDPRTDIRALGETLLGAYAGASAMSLLPDGGSSIPPVLKGILDGMLSEHPAMQFQSIFDLRHAVSQLDIPPARLSVTVDMVDGYRRERQQAKASLRSETSQREEQLHSEEAYEKPSATKKDRLHPNWKILIAYGLLILFALILGIILKNVL